MICKSPRGVVGGGQCVVLAHPLRMREALAAKMTVPTNSESLYRNEGLYKMMGSTEIEISTKMEVFTKMKVFREMRFSTPNESAYETWNLFKNETRHPVYLPICLFMHQCPPVSSPTRPLARSEEHNTQ